MDAAGGGGGPMRAAKAGSGTIVTTGAGSSAVSTGSRSGSGATASTGGVALFRVRGWVLRVEVFLPFAVEDRFFVATAERHITLARPPHGTSSGR
jgi:hypothetical protein